MTGQEFFRAVSNGKEDILQLLVRLLKETETPYCVIGGLAVNAYVEPVVSLDLDVVVATESSPRLCSAAELAGLKSEVFEHSINLSSPHSDLRVQIQTDPRYQPYLRRAVERNVLGQTMKVATLADVLQGKLWAYGDSQRRMSKRQKDLADILRLAEAHPAIRSSLPEELRRLID
jgi:hypothetical protein